MQKFLCASLLLLLCGSGAMAAGSTSGEIGVSVTVLPIHKMDAKNIQTSSGNAVAYPTTFSSDVNANAQKGDAKLLAADPQ